MFNFKLPYIPLFIILLTFIPILLIQFDYAFAINPTYENSNSIVIFDVDPPTNTIIIPDVSIGNQTDRLLVVSVALDHQIGPVPTVSSITFGPSGSSCTVTESFTSVPSSISSIPNITRNELFYLTAPSISQTCDIVITLTNDVGITPGISAFTSYVFFSEVDQTTPIDNTLTTIATGNSDTPSITISNIDGHFLLDVMSSNSSNSPTEGTNQINRGTYTNNFNFLSGSSTQPGNLDSLMDWSTGTIGDWAISAIAIRSNTLPPLSSGQSGGCSKDCTHPTLGLDSSNKRIISNGFSYNGNSVDVDLFYTAFPMIKVNIGEENKAVLQIYDNSGPQNIKHVGLGFGLGKGESFNNARAMINLDRVNDENLVTIYDPENVLENVKVITKKGKCTDIESECLFVTIFHTFRESLDFNMVSTNIWDSNRNSWQNYFNHGIQIEGASLNPPKTMMVAFGETQMRGLHTLTQINKIDDLWKDEIGNIYRYMGNDRFDRISTNFNYDTLNLENSHSCDRNCYLFSQYKLEQENIAQEKLNKLLDGKSIQNPIKEFYTIKNNPSIITEDVKLKIRTLHEIIRAQDTYDKLFASLEKNRIKD